MSLQDNLREYAQTKSQTGEQQQVADKASVSWARCCVPSLSLSLTSCFPPLSLTSCFPSHFHSPNSLERTPKCPEPRVLGIVAVLCKRLCVCLIKQVVVFVFVQVLGCRDACALARRVNLSGERVSSNNHQRVSIGGSHPIQSRRHATTTIRFPNLMNSG